jgi:hypothetical protein
LNVTWKKTITVHAGGPMKGITSTRNDAMNTRVYNQKDIHCKIREKVQGTRLKAQAKAQGTRKKANAVRLSHSFYSDRLFHLILVSWLVP